VSVRGILTGALALIILEVVVSSNQASGRIGGFFAGVAAAVDWLVDPGVPGIPDRSSSQPAPVTTQQVTTGTQTTTTSTTPVTPTVNTLTPEQQAAVYASTGGLT